MDRVGNAIPFNAAAQAYGRPMMVRPVAAPTNVSIIQKTQQTAPIGQIGQVRPEAPAEPKPASDPSRLVAASVDPIDLSRDVESIQGRPSPAGGYAMYRHPADQNLAATGVEIGRSLDVQG